MIDAEFADADWHTPEVSLADEPIMVSIWSVRRPVR